MATGALCRKAVFAAALIAAALGRAPNGAAASYSVLYSFCPGHGCTDGENPAAPVIADASGNLFGTTNNSGALDVAFALTLDGNETVLHTFADPIAPPGPDGAIPSSGLTADANGNLYGVTFSGGVGAGRAGEGTVYRIASDGTESVIYDFCASSGCPDGQNPVGELLVDPASGTLYGVTDGGGNNSGQGVLYALTPNADRTRWTQRVLYQFCSKSGCTDGQHPAGGLVADGSGALYGVTRAGGQPKNGNPGGGTVFRLKPNGSKTKWKLSLLHVFCSQPQCSDGAFPQGRLAFDNAGNLWGTTLNGGNFNIVADQGEGTVFQLRPQNHGKFTFETAYRFCPGGGPCADGAYPVAGVTIDPASGAIYGTTSLGGANWNFQATNAFNGGAVFQLSGAAPFVETTLYSFCSMPSCTDGFGPRAAVTLGPPGILYGTTFSGGANQSGTVFQIDLSGP